MAHYAELNEKNQVIRVLVIPNEVEPTEEEGVAWCKQHTGGGNWKKTSYNGTIRKHFAGYMYTYDWARDAFIPPKPYPSWILNETKLTWEPPIQPPNDGLVYYWDELTQSWQNLNN